jgi:hypothetical protein
LVVLATGFMASSLSSFFGHFAISGAATDFVQGLLDGLAVVAFGAATFILVRSRRRTQE